jgi:hypothetical protein
MSSQLHWQPVRRRFDYEIAVLTNRGLHDQLPPCLADDYRLIASTDGCCLPSADMPTFTIPCATNSIRNWSFQVAGPTVWNQPPPVLHEWDVSHKQFEQLLKMILFV